SPARSSTVRATRLGRKSATTGTSVVGAIAAGGGPDRVGPAAVRGACLLEGVYGVGVGAEDDLPVEGDDGGARDQLHEVVPLEGPVRIQRVGTAVEPSDVDRAVAAEDRCCHDRGFGGRGPEEYSIRADGVHAACAHVDGS